MRVILVATLAALAAPSLRAQARSAPMLLHDSAFRSLVSEVLSRNPSIARREAMTASAVARIGAAKALPDPMLELGPMNAVLPSLAQNQSDFTEWDFTLRQDVPGP